MKKLQKTALKIHAREDVTKNAGDLQTPAPICVTSDLFSSKRTRCTSPEIQQGENAVDASHL